MSNDFATVLASEGSQHLHPSTHDQTSEVYWLAGDEARRNLLPTNAVLSPPLAPVKIRA